MQVVNPITLWDSGGSFTRASTGSYFDSTGALQSAANDTPRITFDPSTLICSGLLLEAAATNLVLNSATGTTQGVTVTAVPTTISFYGSGTITMTGASLASVVGLGTNLRKTYTFTPTAGTLTLTPSGSVSMVQVEAGAAATSYIPTTSATVTRAADTVSGTGVLYIGGLPETDDPVWVGGHAYAVADLVIRTTATTHHIYKCAVAHTSSTGAPPETLLTGATPTWVDMGATNKWAAFDGGVGTQSTKTGTPFTILLKPGVITDSLTLLNTLAAQINVSQVSSAGAVVFNENDITDDPSEVTDWYPFFFSSPKQRTELVYTEMPAFVDGVIAITMFATPTTGTTAVGMITTGTLLDCGLDQYGLKVGITDLSRVSTDEFGNTTIVKRGYTATVDATCELKNYRLDAIVKGLQQLGSVPCVWIGANDIYDVLTVYGLGSFSVELTYFDTSFCTLGIKGLI